jgi:hypothetical protein
VGGAAVNDIMWMAAGSTVLLVWGVVIFSLVSRLNEGAAYDDYDSTLCAPSRRANITASVPQAQRRVLGPPAGWHEPQHVAIVPAPARYDDDELDYIEEWDGDELKPDPVPVVVPVVVVPDPAPIVVEDWPTRQPVVVNWTAARFGSLEIRRD